MQLQFNWQSVCLPRRMLRVRVSLAAPFRIQVFGFPQILKFVPSFFINVRIFSHPSAFVPFCFSLGQYSGWPRVFMMRHRQAVRQGTLTPPSQVRLLLAQFMLEQLSGQSRCFVSIRPIWISQVRILSPAPFLLSFSSCFTPFNCFEKKIIEVGI